MRSLISWSLGSREAIGELVPQAGSGGNLQKKSAASWFTPVQETQNSCVGSGPR